ncbi:hypothetical protein PVK06_050057 [Gossypium arboreum]|uniref:Photosystem I P700 chlorophyll a apoprotein A1 n=1 Tax=Gossypium arboreum TaxID=29729 RepID=A0ABR0MA10_GOSAR|nr:hypothetical protein PVK06_049854 [Gossypium arboreum]KAK5769952.1 hypothetical protein PVK06_049840 [Gossypium arboreum]KAK5769955.1 hypothetical protein PVK06_049838 [Gossypium arboreum]KAK5769958.1 hypothetical protein PVK06_049837 [Gossypium arboreum]KAK5769959.1 hypothetical protein PVK06_050057 [Gossypium arboreum]
MIIRSPEPEVKILVDRDPVKTSFEEWARPGHFSRTIAKGPDTTTWIWNLHADAHDFDSHTSDLEEISRKIFSAHFGQLSIIFLWLSGMYFHGARFSNYEAWLSDPTHIGPSAQVVWPIVGQEILNGDVGGGFRGIQITSGFFQIWRASGITSELQLYCTAIGALVFAALMLFAGQGHKGLYEILTTSWHAQLSLNLAMLGSLTIVVAHHMYSMPPYPYLATDYGTQLSLFTHHMWIGGFLIVGAAAHAAIFMSDVWGTISDQGVVTHITGGNFAQSSITINGWLRDFLWAQASQEDLKGIMALRFPRFSQGLAQDPTTRRIWFGIATAHDFESHDDITEERLYQNIFASHFGQLAIIFLWTSGNLFHRVGYTYNRNGNRAFRGSKTPNLVSIIICQDYSE